MAYETSTYTTANDLLSKLRTFLTGSGVDMQESDYSADGTGYRLHLYDEYGYWNFRSALNEASVVDTQSGNLSGIAMNYSIAYVSANDWDKQTGFTQYDNSTADSVACFLSTTLGTYWFYSSNRDYQILIRTSTGIYQFMSFGRLAGTGTNDWIYMSSTVSGYLANYSTNGKRMLFGDHVNYSGSDYGSFFAFNGTNQYNTYDATYTLVAPVDDVTVATMDKFQSVLWEEGINAGNIAKYTSPIIIFYLDGTDYVYCGYIRNISLFNMSNNSAEDEIVFGNYANIVFPLNSSASDYVYRAVAILEDDISESYIPPDGYCQFDNVNDYILIDSSFKSLPTNFTFAFWYNWGGRAAARETFLGSYTTSNKTFWVWLETDGRLKIRWRTATSGTGYQGYWGTTNPIPLTDSWNNIIIKVDTTQASANQRLRIYVNGVDDTDYTDSVAQDTVWTGISQFAIGARVYLTTNDYNYGGKLKQFIYCNKTWDATDIANYQLLDTNNIDNKVIHYRMNDANTFTTPYGDFNGTDNVIDTGFKPAAITVGNPLEVVLKHRNDGSIRLPIGSKDVTLDYRFYGMETNVGSIYMYYGDTNYVGWNVATIGSYSGTWIKMKWENDGAGNFDMSLWGLNSDGSFTQIGSTQTRVIGNLPDYNIYVGARNDSGTTYFLFGNAQIRSLTGNGKTWYFNPATSNTIKSTDGATSLTVSGTVTNFFVNDEPYTDAVVDSSGNGNHGTPNYIYPPTFFNQV